MLVKHGFTRIYGGGGTLWFVEAWHFKNRQANLRIGRVFLELVPLLDV